MGIAINETIDNNGGFGVAAGDFNHDGAPGLAIPYSKQRQSRHPAQHYNEAGMGLRGLESLVTHPFPKKTRKRVGHPLGFKESLGQSAEILFHNPQYLGSRHKSKRPARSLALNRA